MKPLRYPGMDPKNKIKLENPEQKKVTCIHITPCGTYLVAGYKKGHIAVWDLSTYELVRCMTEIHKTQVTQAKIFHISTDNEVSLVSIDDSGQVSRTRITKKMFGGYSNETSRINVKANLNTAVSLALHQQHEIHRNAALDGSCFMAIGSATEVAVISIFPKERELFSLVRPAFCRP